MLERFFGERRYRFNAHAHSTCSDGALTPWEIDALAGEARHKHFLIAITDHNTVRAHEDFASPRIIPGVEVKTAEGGVDVLLYAERERLLEFFHTVIEPSLDRYDPIFGATRLAILDLVGLAHEAGMEIVIPHYSHNEGLSVLPPSLQREVARFPVFIELNALLTRSANAAAKRFAHHVHRPLIAAGDSHRSHQYLSSYTSLTLPLSLAPTGAHLFHALRSRPHRAGLRLSDTGLMDRIATGWQILRNAGVSSVVRQYVRGKVAWLTGGELLS